MAVCKVEALKLLKREAFLKARNYKVKVSLCIREVEQMVIVVSDTKAGPNLLKKNRLLGGFTRHAVLKKAQFGR